MPHTQDGRPLSYVALNGHGSYPKAGFIPRIFLAFNDRTGPGITIIPCASQRKLVCSSEQSVQAVLV